MSTGKSVSVNPRSVNQNPPVTQETKCTLLRVLDFIEEPRRGGARSELERRAGLDYQTFDRGMFQLETEGMVTSFLASKSMKAKGSDQTWIAYRITDAGRAYYENTSAEPDQKPVPCRALVPVPCMALVPMRLAAPVFAFRFMMSVWEQYAPAETFTSTPVFAPAPF